MIGYIQKGNRLLRSISYSLYSGRNSKVPRYIMGFWHCLTPSFLCQRCLPAMLAEAAARPDSAEIMERLNYYCKLSQPVMLPANASALRSHQLRRRQMMYFFDAREVTRYFPKDVRWIFLPGDITEVPEYPSIVKSRPIYTENFNSVLLKLNRVRHFNFISDRLRFSEKDDLAVFRGKIKGKPKRRLLFRKFFGAPFCDLGDTSDSEEDPDEWKTHKQTIAEQLRHKFVLTIEGNDVASSLKWVMSSNSLAVMPEPEYETWFMEGCLKPDVHYIRIERDFDDLPDKLKFYSTHTDSAEKIILNAHRHVERFLDPRREKLISLLVLNRYFRMTNPEFVG